MAIRKVIQMGHPILREVAAPVSEKDIRSEKIQTLIKDMIETMFEYDGRGLAAPQIAESLQVVVMLWDFEPEQKTTLAVLINPEIKPLTQETSAYWEGCLSVPGLRGKVERPHQISVEALNEKGEKVSFKAEGFAATVIQHECDHLQGRLYVDHIKDMHNLAYQREYEKYLAGPDTPQVE